MKHNRNMIPLVIVALGGLILAAAVIWLITGIPVSTPTLPTSTSDVKRVSLKDAYQAYKSGKAVFLDVRVAGSYDSAHIPGALNIPLDELPDRLNELSKNAWILTYCT